MKLTEEALKLYWRNRKQIFNAPENQAIIKRFFWLSGLFDRINGYSITIDSKTNSPQIKITKNKRTYDISIKSNDKKGTAQNPSSDYFACVKDNVLTNGGLTGVQQMAERFSATGVNNLPQLITEIGCMLSGSEFNTDSNYFDRNKSDSNKSDSNKKFIQENFPYKTPIIHEEFRIISNTITEANDTGTLTSVGQMRHPTLHLANNNYFYHVINIINKINSDLPQTLVLRWPDSKYYNNQEFQSNDKLDYSKVQKNQLDTLIHRFPYKFFYMWANKDINKDKDNKDKDGKCRETGILHLIGLAAYRGLVNSDINKTGYNDQDFNQEFQNFRKEWPEFSQAICNIVTPQKPILVPQEYNSNYNFKYDYINELSLLLSIVLSKPQEMVDTTELIESGNKALILWGPPGTGKTYTAKQIIRELLKLSDTDNLEDYKFKENLPLGEDKLGCWSLVQFHPNYTYEDFIGGISPDLKQSNLSYTLKEGIFKKICDAARKDNQFSDIAAAANYVNKATQTSYRLPYIKKAIASIKEALNKIESDKKIDLYTYNYALKDCWVIISKIFSIAKDILQKIQPADTNSVEDPANSEITIESIDKIIDELNKIIDPNKNKESNPDFTSLDEQIIKVGEIIDKLETQEKEANNQNTSSDNNTNRDESTSTDNECEKIYKTYSKKYILIIDEINRADLSAVFGELMYALEYRNEKITIPNFEEEFTIPDNVYIIGTMNSIDKSLVTFDLALRRRFSFYKVMPQIPVLNTILAAYQISQKSLSTFLSHCLKLNAQISGVNEDGDSNADKNALMLGEDYQIGQAYFAKIKDFLETDLPSDNKQDIRPDHMQKLWSYHLLPLLEEYLGNQVEDADIKKKLKEIEKQFVEMDDKSNN